MTNATRYNSCNKDERPGSEISLIVIHCISLPPGEYGSACVQQLFCNELDCSSHPDFDSLTDVRVSSHLFIRRDGSIQQFVSFPDRAWHAGESSYNGRADCNDFSIGIELEGTDSTPFEESQYVVLEEVCRQLCECYEIHAIAGHSDIAPTRKTDPGLCFDWGRIRSLLDRGD